MQLREEFQVSASASDLPESDNRCNRSSIKTWRSGTKSDSLNDVMKKNQKISQTTVSVKLKYHFAIRKVGVRKHQTPYSKE